MNVPTLRQKDNDMEKTDSGSFMTQQPRRRGHSSSISISPRTPASERFARPPEEQMRGKPGGHHRREGRSHAYRTATDDGDVRFDDAESNYSMASRDPEQDLSDTPRSTSSTTESESMMLDDFEEVELSPREQEKLFAEMIPRKYQEDPSQFFFMVTVPPRNHPQPIAPGGQFLLPPRDPKDRRKTMILDLDETLVHCFLNRNEFRTYDSVLKVENEGMMLDVYCKIRPFVHTFLKEASKMFEIVVFTASQASYANKVLDLIDPNKYISHRLFRRHCEHYQGNYLKDLSKLGRNLKQTFIIDNFPLCFSFQPLNGIPCETWHDDPHDDELMRLLTVLQKLHKSKDVRRDINGIWGTGKFLAAVSYHAKLHDY